MKESDYQKKHIDKLTKDGWFVLNLIKTNKNGISDLLALKDGEPPTFIECKTPTGKLSKIQVFRLNELQEKGFDCFVSYGDDIREWKKIIDSKCDLY